MGGAGEIILKLPKPLSVNRTRRIDWSKKKLSDRWIRTADGYTLAAGTMRGGVIAGQFEAELTIDDDAVNVDLDNTVKICIDYARRLGLIKDDSKQYMRRVIIQWGAAPTGCTLVLRALPNATLA